MGNVILNPFTGNLQIVGACGAGSGVVATPAIVLKKGSATTVPASTKSTVLTLTAVVDTYITKIIGSGHDYAKWYLVLDTVDQNIRRSEYDKSWNFTNPWKISAGSVVDLKVEHFIAGDTLDFEGTIWGYT